MMMERRGFLSLMAGLAASGLAGCKAEEGASGDGTTEIQETGPASLEEMDWEQIAEVASSIASAPDDETGFRIARDAHLMEEDSIVDSVKRFKTDDGFVCEVRVVGVRHDRRAADGNVAGLTLMTANPMALSPWGEGDVAGGWGASTLAAWCRDGAPAILPQELISRVVEVTKRVNDDGAATSPDQLTDAALSLWVPAAVEVCGTIHWYAREFGYHDLGYYDDVLNGEGSQYRWFSQNGVGDDGTHEVLALTYEGKPVPWWYRSPVASTNFRQDNAPCAWCAMDSGFPKGMAMIGESQGVTLGFCL